MIPLMIEFKKVQIVYRLFLVNCYLLHVPRLPFQLASIGRGSVIDFIWLELPRQYMAMTRNNLSIISISIHRTILCKVIIYKSHGGNQQLNVCFWPILESYFHFIAFFWSFLWGKKIKHEKLQADPIPAKISNSVP